MNMGFVVTLYFHAWNIKKIIYMSTFVLNIEIEIYFLHATMGHNLYAMRIKLHFTLFKTSANSIY
jgi:hypothetical protein